MLVFLFCFFFDDILVYSKTLEDHLRLVLGLLKWHTLYATMSKCMFGVQEIKYLGHLITGKGVQTDPSKIADCSHG